jgi:hypothetical protein
MDTVTILVVLEEHLLDIRAGLVDSLWRRFVEGLERCTTGLKATRKALDDWTDGVVDLMKGFDYTKGLLRGLAISAALGTRAVPRRVPLIDVADSGDPDPIAASEQGLVARILDVVHRAKTIA